MGVVAAEDIHLQQEHVLKHTQYIPEVHSME